MFQFPGFPSVHYLFMYGYRRITNGEFPHSDICGSMLICSSPQLFAAYHVLLRRLMPRHPPYALISLIVSQSYNFRISLLVSFLTNISVLFELQDIFYTPIVLVLCYLHLTLTISRIHIICFTMQLSMCKRSASLRAKPRLGHKKSITINSFPRLPLCQRYIFNILDQNGCRHFVTAHL